MPECLPRILVFVPTYRCAAQITRVLDQFDDVVQGWIDTVMVVDNRSPDDSLQAAIVRGKERITRSRFIVWINDHNYGLGGSHKAAFRYALEEGFDYVVVLHGDDQADIHDLIPQLEHGAHLEVDCLLGARFMKASRLKCYSWMRTLGNRAYNKLFSLATRRHIDDLGSGLNLYRMECFRDFYYKTFPDDLTFNYILLLASCQAGQTVRFFPISWREEDQRSNVRLFHQAIRVLWLLTCFSFGRNRFLVSEMRSASIEAYSGKIVHHSGNRNTARSL